MFSLSVVLGVMLTVLIRGALSSGFFEIHIDQVMNPRGELANGQCCRHEKNQTNDLCNGQCRTFFRLCLKEYQPSVDFTAVDCTFGNLSSDVMGPNTFSFPAMSEGLIVLPFNFSWTRSFSLILETLDRSQTGSVNRIERTLTSGYIQPGEDWKRLTHNGYTATLRFSVRVRCAPNYYNSTCTKLCHPRNDTFGHYTCDVNGDKKCLDGWMGSLCETAMCRPGCHSIHGTCRLPGECSCDFGWAGPLCDRCIPYPGCQHGTCRSPWTCSCERNWGGNLCDQDLNPCGTLAPCQNGGVCNNTAPNQYECTCVPGYTGDNCQILERACASSPCQNNGTCIESGGSFRCLCTSGWSGQRCQTKVDDCAQSPCLNSGTCRHDSSTSDVTCTCPDGWYGQRCQLNSQCYSSPCHNAIDCKRTPEGEFTCECQPGWTGKFCDVNIDDCAGQCKNGALCQDYVNDFYCVCAAGYTGRFCQVELNECSTNPCLNHGQCVDRVNGHDCLCQAGFSGKNCQLRVDHCTPNQCEQGASCFSLADDFYCQCPDGWMGKTCAERRLECPNGTCGVYDSCTTPVPVNLGAHQTGIRLVSSDICGQHGTCVSTGGGRFTCLCDRGFKGQYCQINEDDCLDNPCMNDGTCIDEIKSRLCICADGWEGPSCNINRDDCQPNPCRNGAQCTDLVADFRCTCAGGWKGKMCNLRTSACNNQTCANGGTCTEIGDSFVCNCPRGWRGTMCHLRETHRCDASPCKNGATCVNTGDSYDCVCRAGYEGPTCAEEIDDCNPYPCYNDGKCIDGVNFHLCQCKPGFAGPYCRINIDECVSSPCSYGSTCVDDIGGYHCVCPLYRTGTHCEQVKGHSPVPKQCTFQRRLYDHLSSWEHECNACTCNDGKVSCTKLWCGPSNCIYHPNNTEPAVTCAPRQTCVIRTEETCFTPPCLPFGHCQDQARAVDLRPNGIYTHCLPNSAKLDNNCAKVTLVFDKSKMPAGVSVETVCDSLRRVTVAKRLARTIGLLMLCGIQDGHQDAIEVTVFTDTRIRNPNSATDRHSVHNFVTKLGDYVSRKLVNSSALAAVMEVKVETTIINGNTLFGYRYLIPVVCAVMVILWIMAILFTVYWYHARPKLQASNSPNSPDQPSNNEPDNIRYKNPLFETSAEGKSMRRSASHELIKLNIEKYEKSPKRHSYNENLVKEKELAKLKGSKKTNIEIQESLKRRSEIVV